MKRHLGRTLVLALAGLLAGMAVVLRTDWAGEQVCAQARTRLPALLGLGVEIDRCRIDPLRGGAELLGVRLKRPGDGAPSLASERVFVRLGALQILAGKLRLSRVELDRPDVSWSQTPASSPAPTAAGKPKEGCFVDELKRLEIDSLSINGGALHVFRPDGRGLDLEDADLELRLRGRTYGIKLSIPRGGVQTGNVRLPLSRLRVAGSLDLARQRLSLKQLELAAGELSASARGEVETLCDPSLAFEASAHVPLDLVSAVIGPGAPRMSGAAEVVVRKAEGTLKDPLVEAEVSFERAQVEQFEFGDGLVEARLERDRVRLDKVEILVGEGRVSARGAIELRGELPIRGSVDLEGLEFGRVIDRLGVKRPWVNFEANGEVEVGGTLAPFHLVAPASLDVRDFRVWDRPFEDQGRRALLQFDRAHVDLTADFDAERARLGKARIRSDRSDIEADARLYYEPARGMDIGVKMKDLDLADLGHIVGIPWDGHLAGKADVRVLPSGVGIRGNVSAREFKFHKLQLGAVEAGIDLTGNVLSFANVSASRGRSRIAAEGQLDFGRGGDPIGRGRGAFEGARLSDLMEMVGDEHWTFELARHRLEARASGQAVVDGPVSGPRSRIHVALEDATFLDRRVGSGDFLFRSEDGERVFIDHFDFDGPCGHIGFGGRVDLGLGMEFSIEAPELNASELFKPDAEFIGAAGSLSIQARLFGPPDRAQMTGEVFARNLSAFGVGLGSGRLALTLDRTDLRLKGPLGGDLLIDGRVAVEGDMPFAVGVSANTVDMGHYAPSVPGLSGSLTGELLATGTLERFKEARGDLGVSALSLKKGDFAAQNDGPIALAFAGSAVEIRSLALKGSTGLRLVAAGLKDEQGNLDLTLQGGFDARFLEEFTSFHDLIEQAAGGIRVHATVFGSAEKPTIVGAAESQDVRFSVRGFPVSVRDVKGSLEFSQNKVRLQDFRGTVNGGDAGNLGVSGEVEMKGLSAAKLDLGFSLDRVQYRYLDVPATFSGEVRLSGPPSDLQLGGKLDLVHLRYAQDFLDLETVLRDLRRRHMEARSFERKDEFLRYNVALSVLDDTRVENNFVRAALKGNLNISGTNAHMGATGTLSAMPGGRAFYRGNELMLTHATIRFMETDRIAETVDVLAEGQVRDYRVAVHAYGPLEDPVVDLTSEPFLSRSDVFTLLTLDVTRGDMGSYTSGGGLLFLPSLLDITGVGKQFQRLIPQSDLLRSFKFKIATQYSEASGIVEPIAVFESRVATDALRLRFSQPMISGKGRRVQAEYRLDEEMSVQAQWDNENTDSSMMSGDLGLDLKLRWELE